ncbi:class I SAM-dependent methyltransferase [Streptomyces sp. SAI-090]|jgi:ubiquinone/menaquinone biosynthesis C-methylase UbiE|uniref:class I SAM-dependent methyltransferase n=1 Tax=Streptomyces sp. SAI-090 TaxID=2940545 RepID=UPI00247550F4|nr:class I SAM-dependent methyltransferase [Streptomyces sp. SAI-090]MDH6522290.1 ubiquinone/menaquinone biosynthesis C-methylase UbiE [Streptomyces sp. SAI-090]
MSAGARYGRPVKPEHVSRDAAVTAQFGDSSAAVGYAAAYEGWAPATRYFLSRLHVVDESLRSCAGGDLLDVGCGPGMLVHHLLDTRPGDFHITACDRSAEMIEAVAHRVGDADRVRLSVARIEDMPFPDHSFNVVLAMGVLEYTDTRRALDEISRVIRPGGLVVVTMLNPRSPYRLFEWCVYWPALRALGRVERLLGVPPHRCHGAPKSGIRAVSSRRLRRLLRDAGLRPEDTVFYDLTAWLPPLDKVIRRRFRQWRSHPETTVSRRMRRWLGSAYLIAARPASESLEEAGRAHAAQPPIGYSTRP